MNSPTMPTSPGLADAALDGAVADDQDIASLIAEMGNGLLHASQINMMLCGGIKSLQAALVPQVGAIILSLDALRRDAAEIGDHQSHDRHDRIERFMSDLLCPPVAGSTHRHGQLLAQYKAIQAIIRKETGASERHHTFQTLISALKGTADQLTDLVGQYRSGLVATENGLPAERIELCEIIKDHMLDHARSAEAALAQYEASLAVVDRLSSDIDGLFTRFDMLLGEMNDVATNLRVRDCDPLDLESIGDSALALSVAIEQFQAAGRKSSAKVNESLSDLIRVLSLDVERSQCQHQELQARITTLGLCGQA